MTTRSEFYLAKKDTYTIMQTEIKNSISTALQNVKLKQDEYDSTYDELSAISIEIQALRIALSEALMPADVESLALQFRDKQAELRKKNVILLDVQLALEEEKTQYELHKSDLKRVESVILKTKENLQSAQQQQALHDNWSEIVTGDTLAEFVVLAQTLLDEKESVGDIDDENVDFIRAALIRVNEDIPEALRDRAQQRYGQVNNSIGSWKNLLSSLEDKFGDFHTTNLGPTGTIEDLWIDYIQKENNLSEFSQNCLSLYSQAVSLIKSIVSSVELTDSERDRIHDADIQTDALDALTQELARDEAQTLIDSTYVTHQVAIATAIAAKPLEDADTDADVINALTAYNDAKTALVTAETAFTQEMKDNLDLWEASIPNHIWQNLIAYDQGISLLTTLTTTVTGDLLTDMNTAESALTVELEKEDELAKIKFDLEDTISLMQGKVKYYHDSRQARILSSVRGDN